MDQSATATDGDLLDIPDFLRGRTEALAQGGLGRSTLIFASPPCQAFAFRDPKTIKRERRERLNKLAAEVQTAIDGGATTTEEVIAALPHLQPGQVSDGIRHLRQRRRLAEFLASREAH